MNPIAWKKRPEERDDEIVCPACYGGYNTEARLAYGPVYVELLREDPTCAKCGRTLHRRVIVSRHPAAVDLIRAELPEFANAPVLESATRADVAGRIVAGNLPLHLAAIASSVWAVEFSGAPPRGTEYGLAEMRRAGARLRRYAVTALYRRPRLTRA